LLAQGTSGASVAIAGSTFTAVDNRECNFTAAKTKRRMVQIEKSVARYASHAIWLSSIAPTGKSHLRRWR
jgi:hypothetical protein